MAEVKLIYPENGQTVDTCAEYQKEFSVSENFRKTKKVIRKLIKAKKDEGYFTLPSPVKFSWEYDGSDSLLEISETEDFGYSEKIITERNEAEVYNLKKGAEYFWRVNGSESRKFTVDSVLPRWIKAGSYYNIRDVGGYENTDGAKIKQGLLFRGIALETFTDSESPEILKKFGIKTEIDLRREAEGKLASSPLGENVKYIYHPCNGYDDFLFKDEKDSIKELFGFFAEEENYPIYFHCYGGADRTGTVAFFLGAILSLSDDELINNYELTMIASPEKKMSRSRKGKIKKFLKILKEKDGTKSVAENAVGFLSECGIDRDTFDRIRHILLDGGNNA